jgi:hypothetical protein
MAYVGNFSANLRSYYFMLVASNLVPNLGSYFDFL